MFLMRWVIVLTHLICSGVHAFRTTMTSKRQASGSSISSKHLPRKKFSLRLAAESVGSQKRLFIFGLGYVGTEVALRLIQDGSFFVSGTCTNVRKIESLESLNIKGYLFDSDGGGMFQKEALSDLMSATHILCTVPPIEGEDPVICAHGVELRRLSMGEGRLEWLGYLSSTGVYGDRGGAWVTEADTVAPLNKKTKGRTLAENGWMTLKEKIGLPVHIFRLAGIYGPGRSALDTVRKVDGDISQCGANDNVFISRCHVDDIVTVLLKSMESPSPGLLMNVCDDLPSTRYEVLSFACKLLKYPMQKPDSSMVNDREGGVRGGSKRVDNSRMRNMLMRMGSNLKYSDYRSGLQSIFYGDYNQLQSNKIFTTNERDVDIEIGKTERNSLDTPSPAESQKLSAVQSQMNELMESNKELKNLVSKLLSKLN